MENVHARAPSELSVLRRRGVDRPVVWLASDLVEQLQAQADQHRPLETGGMLLGWRVENELVITEAIGAGPGARRARDSFEADGPWQEGRLLEVYERSGRTVIYLGDWHSHPRGPARPSRRDRETAAVVAGWEAARTPEPLTLIIGRRSRRWRMRCFIYVCGQMRRARLLGTPPS